MKSLKHSELKEIIREILRDLYESSVSGNVSGYETPNAFAGGMKKNREFKKKMIKKLHMNLVGKINDVVESVDEDVFDSTGVDWSGEMMWKWVSKALKSAGIKELKYTPMKSGWLGGKFVWGGFYQVRANKRKDVLPFTVDKKGNLHLNVSPNKFVIGKIGKLPQVVKNLKDFKKSDLDVYESVNEAVSPKGWNMSKKFITILAREVKNLQKYHRQQNDEDFLEVANYMELQLKYMKKNLNESVNEKKSGVLEGHYHEYRNDETRTPKQKVWHSIREVRDSLIKLERNLKHAIKLKNENNMDSRTYYKYAKNSMTKIQERLIKMAGKIGELGS